MANTALTFNFATQALRALMIDGEPWFVAADVCSVLEHSDTSKAVSRLDDDEKLMRTMFVSGQNREMLVINESGLYSLILTSRKPEAKKFKKWVTSEVLPAIRKTGRYVDPVAQPQPTPASSAEQLNASDMQHLKRMVWAIASNFHQEESASQGVWKHLRLATNNPAPYPYTVEHIPTLGAELQRLMVISHQVRDITAAVEAEVIRRIFRRGDLASQVLAHAEAKARQALAHQVNTVKALPTWLANDIEAFAQRRPCLAMGAHYAAEQPDFFGAAR